MVRIRSLEPWTDPRGGQIERLLIDNGTLAIEVLSLGGIIRSLWAPDRDGERANLVLGCDSAEGYLTQDAYLGAIVGRYANRIANGQFNVGQTQYPLDTNQDSNCLHGGREGFHRQQWQLGTLPDGVRLSLRSPDGDMGFPGNCNVQLDYRLVGNNLYVEILASSDKPCPISLTQHSYFNLDASESSLDHQLQVDATQYLEMNNVGIPSAIRQTHGSGLDLSLPTQLQSLIGREELTTTSGIDHCFLMPSTESKLQRFGSLSSPLSGRSMTLYTNQPGVQVYGGNGLEGVVGKNQHRLNQYQGVCLEPQQIPDAPNQPHIAGDALIAPGEIYHHISRYQFENDA
ncbi:Aldose 1-epimerase [Shewanella halifaxensis HAW-EB4]|uniref:Aldose 1-epimerase n=1 Tax=Shewanella halifaxensis (strain HAW-EB4) TaxID=458817 RepID=B0TSR4_SHEHH|nr:aldose epimerase family protein [Shewanella halifaxensis]ABZ75239.1 Aldose 1-epimerase [Shewanella halifaxensis HAW-EB4]